MSGKESIHPADTVVPVLEGRGLRVARSGFSILEIDLILIAEGEVLSLVGPNGAGKTTLLVALCLLTKSLEGQIFFRGEKVGGGMSVDAYRRRIAMVFQEPLLFDTTVFANVASGLNFRKTKKSMTKRIVDENLERFGIAHLRDRSARTLSGGEAQRVSLARAFAIAPDILFLDEPFSALDPPTRESLISDFEAILGESRTTTIFATHDRMEALRLSDRIAVMNNGKTLQIGYPEEVMNHPLNEFIASFVGVETILRGRVAHAQEGEIVVSVGSEQIEAIGDNKPGEQVILCIRPENVTLLDGSSDAQTSARNHFPGVIKRITPLGLHYRLEMDCGFPLVAYVTKHSLEHMSLSADKKIAASFKATAVHVLKAKG
ncbi:MAG TPA: ABC transporter ATP-binding protein [Syntrophorhabdaceae bacterium]|nr:ABC transporter ATP-binding protein [Syntrophorhabdaceae bacterium]